MVRVRVRDRLARSMVRQCAALPLVRVRVRVRVRVSVRVRVRVRVRRAA